MNAVNASSRHTDRHTHRTDCSGSTTKMQGSITSDGTWEPYVSSGYAKYVRCDAGRAVTVEACKLGVVAQVRRMGSQFPSATTELNP